MNFLPCYFKKKLIKHKQVIDSLKKQNKKSYYDSGDKNILICD